jgi:hypothetical protein
VADRSTAGSGFGTVVVVVGETVGELVHALRSKAMTTSNKARNLTLAMLP